MNERKPQTLIEAIRYFSDLDVANAFVADLRWSDGPVCDKCGGVETSYLTTRRIWKCKACKRQFSVKVGTIFEDSPLGLDKWLPAVWMIANSKNGVSSHELGRALGVTQKSAWFMLHRIRLAMQTGTFDKFNGIVEVDETYIGGDERNRHAAQKEGKKPGWGGVGKIIVAGALNRGGEVRAEIIPSRRSETLVPFIKANVEQNSTVYTDSLRAYNPIKADFDHDTVDHHIGQYVNGVVYTNGIENFWSLLKRSLKGTYIHVAADHLFRYVDERAFAFNNRKTTDLDRFTIALNNVAGRRLDYKTLTGKA
ncbi:MAG TPA: IS1595 family transposase [Galbitalea sp.]|jgi:transposase-like protein|nr:IS1595 family transposase [Galbitalea sp.]